MSETVRVSFMFQRGQQVRWAGDGYSVWTIEMRRYTERAIMPPFIQYGLTCESFERVGAIEWAYEPDLVPLEEDPEHA